jgi:hypothetical protein
VSAPTPEFPSLVDYLQDALTADELSHVGLISFNHWSFALGAVVEVALQVHAMGKQVTVALWADETPMPDTGWTTSRLAARLARTRTRDENAEAILRAAGLPADSFAAPPLRRWKPVDMPALPAPLTRASIRALNYRGSGMGRSILQVHPDANTPIHDSYLWPRRYTARAMKSYAWAFDQASALIEQRGLKVVVVYNGRFTHDRAVAAAAEQAGIRVLYHDTGGYETDFDLTDATTHDWAHLQGRMLRMYDAWDPAQRDAIGSSWFLNRQTHADDNNRLFTGTQTRGHVEGLPEADRLVVFFSSSGDEIAELDLDWESYLHSQEDALSALAAQCRSRPGTALVVRTHPHMRLKPADDLRDWMAAVAEAGPDVHFDPNSAVDSYALMKAADIVFTYGSTAGVESGFIGRPVVVMGPSAYDLLGCARRITRVEEISDCLDNPPAPAPTKAIPYGLMMQRRGFRYASLSRTGSGDPAYGSLILSESSELARKLSDASKRLRIWWLTRG